MVGWAGLRKKKKNKKKRKHESCAYKPAAKASGLSLREWRRKVGGEGKGFRGQRSSHGLKLVNSLLGVSLADLAQRLVLISAGLDVLGVQHVILRLLRVVPGLRQL